MRINYVCVSVDDIGIGWVYTFKVLDGDIVTVFRTTNQAYMIGDYFYVVDPTHEGVVS